LALSIFVFFVVFVVQIGAAGQQLPAARLSFEVASVKRSPDPRSVPIFNPVVAEVQPGGVWRSTFATVFGLLRTLYPGHLLPGQIVGPEWIGTEFYDINARGPVSASADDLREMARTLLADRFKLVLHTEKRQVIAYRLVTARADGRLGPGLSMSSIDCAAYRAAKEKGAPLPVDPKRRPFGDRMPCVSTVMPVFDQTRVVPGAEMRITAGGATIASIIPILSRELDRPLVDATGLTQVFDIELQYSLGVPRPDAEPGRRSGRRWPTNWAYEFRTASPWLTSSSSIASSGQRQTENGRSPFHVLGSLFVFMFRSASRFEVRGSPYGEPEPEPRTEQEHEL
jgi:uncharacterized protein (TIGR03435 family)